MRVPISVCTRMSRLIPFQFVNLAQPPIGCFGTVPESASEGRLKLLSRHRLNAIAPRRPARLSNIPLDLPTTVGHKLQANQEASPHALFPRPRRSALRRHHPPRNAPRGRTRVHWLALVQDIEMGRPAV